MTQSEGEMTFFEHLDELRSRLIYSILSLLVFTLASYFFIDTIFQFALYPFHHSLPELELITLDVTEGFFTSLKLSVYCGVFLASPVIIFEIWKFVLPALIGSEKRVFLAMIPLSSICFLTGICFAFFVIVPLALKFLVLFAGSHAKPQISLSSYITFIGNLSLVFGLAFQFPLIITMLNTLGIISTKFLIENRKYNLILSCFVGALLTPPDPFTQLLMAIPLVLLYEVGILMCGLFLPQRSEQEPEHKGDDNSPE